METELNISIIQRKKCISMRLNRNARVYNMLNNIIPEYRMPIIKYLKENGLYYN